MDSVPTVEELKKLRVVDLKERLGKLGKSTSGKFGRNSEINGNERQCGIRVSSATTDCAGFESYRSQSFHRQTVGKLLLYGNFVIEMSVFINVLSLMFNIINCISGDITRTRYIYSSLTLEL